MKKAAWRGSQILEKKTIEYLKSESTQKSKSRDQRAYFVHPSALKKNNKEELIKVTFSFLNH
jgi:hypothetical protein